MQALSISRTPRVPSASGRAKTAGERVQLRSPDAPFGPLVVIVVVLGGTLLGLGLGLGLEHEHDNGKRKGKENPEINAEARETGLQPQPDLVRAAILRQRNRGHARLDRQRLAVQSRLGDLLLRAIGVLDHEVIAGPTVGQP